MPNNFRELQTLLEGTSHEHRNSLGEIIGATFGNSPSLLCDHLCFLRAGAIGQFFDARDYKQLVTDVADRVQIDWSRLTNLKPWGALSATEIEAAIIEHIDPHHTDFEDTQQHIPEPIAHVLKHALITLVLKSAPLLGPCAPAFDGALTQAFALLSTDWRKLVAATVYVHRAIRPSSK